MLRSCSVAATYIHAPTSITTTSPLDLVFSERGKQERPLGDGRASERSYAQGSTSARSRARLAAVLGGVVASHNGKGQRTPKMDACCCHCPAAAAAAHDGGIGVALVARSLEKE